MFLRPEEYLPYAPDVLGRKVRVSHESEDCSGSSPSMSIVRNEDGSVSAKCFRCGKFGSYREAHARRRKTSEASGGAAHGSGASHKLPADANMDVREWPSRARLWLTKARVTDAEAKRFGLCYSERAGRVLIPITREGEYVGYQARKVWEHDEGPKYYTRTRAAERMVFVREHESHHHVAVLCEDVLSAIRIGRFVTAVAALGTSISDYAVKLLTCQRQRVIVWLDHDNHIVIRKELGLRNRLQLLTTVDLIHSSEDPKLLSDTDIYNILSRYI